jgi:HCOMODA/2-hydroxy-3-carboxy-muconic semialdehyde decarboxylase
MRHPGRPDRFLLSCSRSPELVGVDDILEFRLDGEAVDSRGRDVYLERFIHAAVFEARADVQAVVHSHAPETIPFGVTGTPLRPMFHVAARMGATVPVWDIADRFGATNLLVANMAQARDMTATMGANRMVLMRGHGITIGAATLHDAVTTAIYANLNARLQFQAMLMGEVRYLSPEEQAEAVKLSTGGTLGGRRTWDYFRHRAGCDEM